jgi:hypothetical protein
MGLHKSTARTLASSFYSRVGDDDDREDDQATSARTGGGDEEEDDGKTNKRGEKEETSKRGAFRPFAFITATSINHPSVPFGPLPQRVLITRYPLFGETRRGAC